MGLGLSSGLPAFADGSASANGPGAEWVRGYWDHQGGNGERDVNVCSYAVGPGVAHCNAQIRQDAGTHALASAPSQPPGSACTASSSTVTLSWSPPSSNGGSPVQGYNVFVGTSSGAESSTPANSSLISGSTSTVTGLPNGTKYYFTVRALNATGLSSPSNELSATPGLPGTPTLVSVVAGPGSVVLSWTQPYGGGARIQGDNVFVGTSSGAESSTPANSSLIARTRVTVNGLVTGTTYYFVVRAVNRNGMGAPSNEFSATPQYSPSPFRPHGFDRRT